MGLFRLGASISTLGLVNPRSAKQRTARNTKHIARTSAATARATEALGRAERERELREQGLIAFNATPTEVREVEQRLALERRERERAQRAERRASAKAERAARRDAIRPLRPWEFWTLGVLGLLLAATLVGLPVTALVGLFMWYRHPWRAPLGTAPALAAIAPPAPSPAVAAELNAAAQYEAATVPLFIPKSHAEGGRHARCEQFVIPTLQGPGR